MSYRPFDDADMYPTQLNEKVQLSSWPQKEVSYVSVPNYLKDLFNGPSSDGGPSSYYDFPQGALTLNDLLEYKGDKQWKGDSFHLSNIVKATWRWGQKSGIDEAYDARKIIYSGCRLLMKYAGVAKLRETLQALLDDPQFQERDTK